jgi:hypothetical protein
VFRASDGRLLGAHILGEEATELIHIAHSMLHSGATVREFIDATYNFPTRADAYKDAAYDALRYLEARAGGRKPWRPVASRRDGAAGRTTEPVLSSMTRVVYAAEPGRSTGARGASSIDRRRRRSGRRRNS